MVGDASASHLFYLSSSRPILFAASPKITAPATANGAAPETAVPNIAMPACDPIAEPANPPTPVPIIVAIFSFMLLPPIIWCF